MKTLIAQLNKSLLGLTPLRDLLEMIAPGTGPEGGRLWAAGQQGATGSLVKERTEEPSSQFGSGASRDFIIVQQAGTATLCLGWTGQLTAP